MRPDSRQSGFALVAAIFLIVVIMAVVIAMAGLSANQTATGDLALQQARAYQAARAGLEWGISRATGAAMCAPDSSPALEGALAEFNVTVTCTREEYIEDGRPVNIYWLTARAQNAPRPGDRPDYAFRQLSAVVE
jgi:MSHA biogenesis protein MshP